ncbi:MAG: deoxynucleoside kinase [Acidimicrobiia bacterium]|nr:deoxynucleoside kinase [Acidimicrobiia bacterium]
MRGERRPRVYYAAGLFNQGERAFNLEVKAVLDELGFETWFPQESAGLLEDYIREGMSVDEARHKIFKMNLRAVEECDILVFVLDGRVPDEGACIEAGLAYGRGKQCIGLKTDFRNVEGGGNNLMIDGILDYRIAGSLAELREMLTEDRVVVDIRDPDNITIDLRALEHSYVAVSGPLGVGKSSLIELLATTGSWTVLREPVMDNPYLSEVYANLSDFAFRNQAFYLGQRAKLHHSARRANGPLIQERCIAEDGEVFTPALRDHGAYDDNDLATLTTLYHGLRDQVPRPDLLLYLTAPFEITLERIRKRDRVGEDDLDVDFLKRIYNRYEEWAGAQNRVPLLKVDTSDLDYVNRPKDAAEIVRRVETLLTDALVLA